MSDSIGAEFEPRIFHSVVKQGGKKKLDSLLALFKAEAPQRIAEIAAAPDALEAKAAARVLKSSAANLGLLGLEELCDSIIAGQDYKAVLPRLKSAHARAVAFLDQSRKAI